MSTEVLSSGGARSHKRARSFRLHVDGAPEQPAPFQGGSRAIRVGSALSNDVVLDDPSASRIHLEIGQDHHGFLLKDLGSTNGTFVEGLRVLGVYLKQGALISAGHSQLRFEALEGEAEVPLYAGEALGPLLGRSEAMRELFETIRRVAPARFTVLVEGESGTGKELIARAIHEQSPRAQGPLVVFDCAASPANLIESELFGHDRGAFTGADASRVGRIEAAHKGTLFLDEIGELPLELQPKLLRALEQREVRRLGSNRARQVDARVVCATNRDLAAEVNKGTFREDLYYRLAVVRIEVPPLRARTEDLPLLIEHFAELEGGPELARALVQSLSPKSWHELNRHPWRGNVRELRNAVERTLAFRGDDMPDQLDVHPGSRTSFPQASAPLNEASSLPAIDLSAAFVEQKARIVSRFEEHYLRGVLAACDGKISRASTLAGLDRMYFKRLMRKYGLTTGSSE